MENSGFEDFQFFNFLKKEDLIRLKEISIKIEESSCIDEYGWTK